MELSGGERNKQKDNIRKGDSCHNGNERQYLQPRELRAKEQHGEGGCEDRGGGTDNLMKLEEVSQWQKATRTVHAHRDRDHLQ